MADESKKDDVIEDKDEDLDEDVDLDLEDDDEDLDGKGDKDGEGKDKDGRKDETPEARAARLARTLDRHNKKHGLGKYAKKDKAEAPEDGKKGKKDDKSGALDYGQKAFLAASELKINGKKEFALVQEYLDTGKSIEDILENRHFANDLKDLREGAATKGAIPKGTRRSQNSASTEVDYWLSKGGLPENTPENQKLRRDIVNARIKAKTDTNVFTDRPVVGGRSRG